MPKPLREKKKQAVLTLRQIAVMQACVDVGTTKREKIANHLHVSKETVHSYFKEINQTLNTQTCAEAVLYCLRHKYIIMPPPPQYAGVQVTPPPPLPTNVSEARIAKYIENSPNRGLFEQGIARYTSVMLKTNDQSDYIDQVAQAVIDRIEERDRIAGLVEMVAQRVMQIQREETALQAAANTDNTAPADKTTETLEGNESQ